MTIFKKIKILLVLVLFYAGTVNAQEWTIPGAVTINVNDSALSVPGTVTISSAGTMTASSGTITVSGNWTNNNVSGPGSFDAGTGRVVLNGSYTAAQLVKTGGTASSFAILDVRNPSTAGVAFFDELYCGTLTASSQDFNVKKISFMTGGTHTLTDLNVNGTASSLITLAPYSSSAAWGLNAGTSTVNYLNVSYSNQTSGKFIYARESNDGSNNVNWIFEGVPLVANNAATSVGQNSATLNAEVYARGTATTVYFAYGTTLGSYNNTATASQSPLTGVAQTTGSQTVSASVSSLSAGTTYYYRAYANNSYGTSSTGSGVSFATSSPPSDPGVTNPAPTYISVNSVSPTSGATNVSVSTSLSATLSDTISGSTVSTSSFKLSKGGSTVSGSVATNGSTITFTPASSLSGSTQYTATITTGVKAANAAGSSLSAEYSWSFTTEAVTVASPTPSATVSPSPTASPAISPTPSPTPIPSPTPESEGKTGVLSVSAEEADIKDYIAITLADENLNTDPYAVESIANGSALWGGATLNRRGDHLSIVSYSSTDNTIGISYPDGYALSAQQVRVASTDNVYVWMVPNTLEDTFKDALTTGSIEVVLGAGTGSGAALVRGDTSGAGSFLSAASTASFVATLDGLNNTVEISPDGTHWISIPITETSEDSGTFAGTIGFDYTALRLTTDSTQSISTLITSANGVTTLTFPDGNLGGNGVQSVVGTGSVVRISDGAQLQFAEVTSANSAQLNVTALSDTTQYIPYKTWVQVIGNDMMPERIDTTGDGAKLFRIGGYFGATYRVRYNDAQGDNDVYMGGDTLSITAPDMEFKTYAASTPETDNTVYGLNSYVVVTLVDYDLNVSSEVKQNTSEYNDAVGNQLFWNENGLGVPSASSQDNASKGYKNGGTAKIVYAGKLSDPFVSLGAFGYTIDFPMTETDKNTGTFKGSFFITDAFPTENTGNILNVSVTDTVYVHYNDSPDTEAEDNSQLYLTSLPITLSESLGVMTLSKDTAYLNGDTIVATVVDSDGNQTVSEADVLTGALKVTAGGYIADDLVLDMIENGLSTGIFIATVKTGGNTAVTSSNLGAFETVQGGVASVIYTDTDPSGATVTKQVAFSAYDAEIAFNSEIYPLDGYAVITLIDAERNANHTLAEAIVTDGVNVFTSISLGTNSAAVGMFETGLDTGTFVGSILISSRGVSSNFTQLRANSGDTLTASYDDSTTVSGGAIIVTDTALIIGATPTPTPTPSPSITPGPSPTPTASITPETSPTPSATPAGECVAETIETDQSGTLEIGSGKSATVVVTLKGENGCLVEGEKITASVTEGGNTIKLNMENETTDVSGEARFIITASSKKTGNAKVQFKYSNKIYVDLDVTVAELTDECTEDAMTVSPDTLTVAKNSSEDIVVTLTGENNCKVEGKKVTASITEGNKNIRLASGEAVTGTDGEAAFTVTGKKKGSAKIQFKASKDVKQTVKVEVTEADCVAKAIASDADDDAYTVEKDKSETIMLTVTGEDGCLVANEKIKATISSGDNRIKLSSEKETTDANGEAQFTITGEKTGNAEIKFKTKSGKKVTVSVTVTASTCVAEAITSNADDDAYTVEKSKTETIILTVTGEEGCLVEGEKVTARNRGGKNKIKLSSEKETTDANGEVQFTITGKKTGNAKIQFKTTNGKRVTVTIKVTAS